MKIITIVGARPQFIKAAVLSRLIKNDDEIEEVLVHTGQHYDENMSDIFFEEMEIPLPKYNLDIRSSFHGEMTGKMIEQIEKVVLKEKPDCILVYGDTNSTLAGAIVAAKLNIKLVHVEAGLRSFNNKMPEEINRILTDRVSNILFCPTDIAITNLEQEGFLSLSEKKIVKSGDIMLDACNFYISKAANVTLKIEGDFIFSTIHRAENTDNIEKLVEIFNALNTIGNSISRVLLPLHPRTKQKISAAVEDFEARFDGIEFANPFSYLETLKHLSKCKFLITDSGGMQKEAFFLRKMCLTLRDQTEWVELVEQGFNILAGITRNEIIEKAKNLDKMTPDFSKQLYGNGRASEIILSELKQSL